MRKTIKNFMFIKRKETAMMMIAVAIAIIGGVVVFDFFVSMGDGETVQLGMVMALSAYVIFDIICEGITFGQHFTLCLQMGVTRKNFLSSYVVFKVIKNMLALSIIAILGAVERVVSKNLVSKLLRVRFVDNYSQVFSGRALVVDYISGGFIGIFGCICGRCIAAVWQNCFLGIMGILDDSFS